MISFRELSYRYPNTGNRALADISLEVSASEFILLAGRSGSGKSTLLKAICGLIPHFSGGTIQGALFVNGQDTVLSGPRRVSELVGYVGQVPENQSVLERVRPEIEFGVRNLGTVGEPVQQRVDEVLLQLGIGHLQKRTIAQLSGGERQKVALAAVLAMGQRVLVLDEPTSQLDPESATGFLETVKVAQQRFGATIIIAGQALEPILDVANRVVMLEQGRVIADETTEAGQFSILRPLLSPMTRFASGTSSGPTGADRRRGQVEPRARGGRSLLVKKLSAGYGSEKIIDSCSFEIGEGEIVGLTGKNGSGKSTLLKAIAGLSKRFEGTVEYDGLTISGLASHDVSRKIGYVPQRADELLLAETVRGELEITAEFRGIDKYEIGVEIDELLERLDIAALSDRFPQDVSVGERQRVALGAVLVGAPPIILLDEPTTGLDWPTKERLIDIWRSLRADGFSLLIASHDVELLLASCDTLLVIEAGKIVGQGTAIELIEDGNPYMVENVQRLELGSGSSVADLLAVA